jgi:hypothetical protein
MFHWMLKCSLDIKVMKGIDEFLNFIDQVFGTEDIPVIMDDVKLMERDSEYSSLDTPALKSTYEIMKNAKNASKLTYKMEVAEKSDLYRIRPSEMARVLAHIDLRLYRNVHPLELVVYDGSKDSTRKCKTLSNLMSKNNALTSFVCDEMSMRGNFKYFYRLAAELLRTKNYNSFECVVSGIRAYALTKKQLLKLTHLVGSNEKHEEMRKNIHEALSRQQHFVPPLHMVLKDIQESNVNANNEMASMRFCKVVELFVYVQNLDPRFKIRNKHEHLLMYRMGQNEARKIKKYEVINEKQYAYFLLW